MKIKSILYTSILSLLAVVAHASYKIGDKAEDTGINISRGNGYVNLKVEDQKFVLYFLDSERTVVAPLSSKATVLFEDHIKKTSSSTKQVDNLTKVGDCLVGEKLLKRPYDFDAVVTLMDILPGSMSDKIDSVKAMTASVGEKTADMTSKAGEVMGNAANAAANKVSDMASAAGEKMRKDEEVLARTRLIQN